MTIAAEAVIHARVKKLIVAHKVSIREDIVLKVVTSAVIVAFNRELLVIHCVAIV